MKPRPNLPHPPIPPVRPTTTAPTVGARFRLLVLIGELLGLSDHLLDLLLGETWSVQWQWNGDMGQW